jgi:hypothetical protein
MDWHQDLQATYERIVAMKEKIPLEFEGAIPMTAALAGYDCRVCMVLGRHQVDEDHYILRTKKDERLDEKGNVVDSGKILEGEMCICLPDHHYAHADHDHVERLSYGEYLEAMLPKDEYERLDVAAWRERKEVS